MLAERRMVVATRECIDDLAARAGLAVDWSDVTGPVFTESRI